MIGAIQNNEWLLHNRRNWGIQQKCHCRGIFGSVFVARDMFESAGASRFLVVELYRWMVRRFGFDADIDSSTVHSIDALLYGRPHWSVFCPHTKINPTVKKAWRRK